MAGGVDARTVSNGGGGWNRTSTKSMGHLRIRSKY